MCIEILNSRFIFIFTNNLQKGVIYEHRTESKGAPYCEKSYPGRTSGVFIQGIQGHKRIEETVYRLESIFKGKRRLM